MPQIKPGHRLYLYRLFARELGVGKQTALDRAADVLTADGLAPADLGFDDARSLFEALDECIKLTVFKKNAVFVTVTANEAYDQALARASKSDGEKPANGKPWKRQRGGKNIKPVRPKHIEPPKPEPGPEPESEPEVEAALAATEPSPAPTENAVEVEVVVDATAEVPEPETADVPEPEGNEPEAVAAEAATGEATAEPEAVAVVDTVAATEPEAAAVAEPAVADDPVPVSDAPVNETPREAPVKAAAPSIHLTITYAPDPIEDPEPAAAPEPEPAPEPAPAAKPEPPLAPAPAPRPSRPANDLPQDFYADVIVTDEPLSALYQVLPVDVDPVATLEEDFRIARSTGTLAGTRSEVSFPLRFQRKNGEPVMATLRRRARSVAGKRWTLASIEADSPEEVGMGALEHKAAGPWAAFANEDQLKGTISPEAELAQFAVLGSWDKLLKQLSELAAPEDWGEDRAILREYLSMTYRRIARQHRLSMADDGSGAAFDTGLVTAEGETIAAVLEPHDGDIAWELTCFSVNAQGQPATYLPHFAQPKATAGRAAEATLDELRRSASEVTGSLRRALQQAIRNPRYATLAYDAVNDRVVGLLPVDGKVCAVVAGENGEAQVVATVDAHDAYVCARVVSSEQPSWLVNMAKAGQAEG